LKAKHGTVVLAVIRYIFACRSTCRSDCGTVILKHLRKM